MHCGDQFGDSNRSLKTELKYDSFMPILGIYAKELVFCVIKYL